MARTSTPTRPLRPPIGTEHLPLLKWLLLVAVVSFGLLGAWHYGLAERIWHEDPTGLTLGIAALGLLTFAAGGVHVVRLSRALNQAAIVERWLERHDRSQLQRLLGAAEPGPELPQGCVVAHLRRLWRKSSPGGHPADQELLLQVFEAPLRRGQELAWFTADLLLTLGLIGTVVGFISMLAPLAGLDPADTAAMKRAIGAMSGGMAVALYTTLAGLLGGLLLRVHGLLLAQAADEVVRRTTALAELHVIPLIREATSDAPSAPTARPEIVDAAA